MKKIWLMLVMICSVCAFTACSDDDETTPEENGGNGTPVCPVKNVKLDKTTAQAGDPLVLSGEGFAVGAKLYLKKTEEIEIKGIAITSDGTSVTFNVPDIEEGIYNLVLEQEGKWNLTPTLTIEKKEVIKHLTGLKINLFPAIDFTMNYTDGKLTSITQTEEGKDPYNYFSFTYGNDSVYITMDTRGGYPKSQGYIVYKDNQVTSCNEKEWSFNEDGYLETAVTGTMIPNNFTYYYHAGNLDSLSSKYMSNTTTFGFKYEGNCPALKGIDVAAISGIVLGGNVGSALTAVHFLNLSGKISAQLPSAITGTKVEFSSDENDEIVEKRTKLSSNIIDSSFDGDGYITKVVIDEKIKFNQEITLSFTWE